MSVCFLPDEVQINCDGCGTQLFSIVKKNLTLKAALDFADDYEESICCNKCSHVPDRAPEGQLH